MPAILQDHSLGRAIVVAFTAWLIHTGRYLPGGRGQLRPQGTTPLVEQGRLYNRRERAVPRTQTVTLGAIEVQHDVN